jgi:hypothetical protein
MRGAESQGAGILQIVGRIALQKARMSALAAGGTQNKVSRMATH